MNNKLVTMAIGATICVILLAGLLIPILDDADAILAGTSEETNTGYNWSYQYDPAEKITIQRSSDGILVNDVDIPVTSDTYNLITGDTFSIDLIKSANNLQFRYIGQTSQYISSSSHLEFENGTITQVSGSDTFNKGTYTHLLTPSSTGDYVNPSFTSESYMNTDAVMYAPVNASVLYPASTAGTLIVSFTPHKVLSVTGTIVLDGTTQHIDDAEGVSITFPDLEQIDSKHYEFTQPPQISKTGAGSGNLIRTVIPEDYTALEDNNASTRSLLNTIPLMLIVAIIATFAGVAVISKRN